VDGVGAGEDSCIETEGVFGEGVFGVGDPGVVIDGFGDEDDGEGEVFGAGGIDDAAEDAGGVVAADPDEVADVFAAEAGDDVAKVVVGFGDAGFGEAEDGAGVVGDAGDAGFGENFGGVGEAVLEAVEGVLEGDGFDAEVAGVGKDGADDGVVARGGTAGEADAKAAAARRVSVMRTFRIVLGSCR
jgi:hypothetical protein